MTETSIQSIRVDKWLWHARFFKTRTLAQSQIVAGKIRVNSKKIVKANHAVKAGDVLTFMKARAVRVIEIIEIAERRGPASEAQQLYNDLSPPAASKDPTDPTSVGNVATRDPGTGRPTKRERRDLNRLRGD